MQWIGYIIPYKRLFFKCANIVNILLEENMFLLPPKIAPLSQKLTEKDKVKWKHKASVVVNPVTATMGRHAALHILDMLL